MVLRWAKLTDARGKKCSFCTIPTVIKRSGISREVMIELGATQSLLWAFVEAAKFWVVGFFGGLSFIEFSSGYGYELLTSMPAAGFIYPLTILYIVYMGIYIHRQKWRSKESIISVMTHMRHCPACVHGIDVIQPEPDGCTVCPECGAAWRMDNEDRG